MQENMVQNIPDDSYEIRQTLLGTERGWELTFDAIPDLVAILDTNHRVIKVNKAMADKLMKSPDSCIGVVCYEVVHECDKPPENCPHKQLLQDGLEHISEVEEENLGGYFIVTASPIKDKDGNVLGSIHIAHDITKRKEMERELEKTLKEKDFLMKEIYHRTKNNLMIISSLLNLQSSYIKDEHARDIFKESQSRAKSMALIHEKLYRSEDLKHLDLKEFVETLSNDLYHTYTVDKNRIKLVLDVEEVKLDFEITIPLGLILNELLTNSLKHAFPNGRKGDIKIGLHKIDAKYKLSVYDNGVGFPESLDYHKTKSLGMLIINSLTDQIGGEIVLDRSKGAKFTIIFEEKYPD